MITEFICSECNGRFKKRVNVKRINNEWVCTECRLKKRRKKRDYLLHEVAGVRRRSELEVEWKKKRELKKKEERNFIPKIKGAKKIVISKQLHLYLTRDEKKVLYKKFVINMSNQDASDRVKYISEKMKELAKKIKVEAGEKKLTSEQMNKKFLEGLAEYSEVEE